MKQEVVENLAVPLKTIQDKLFKALEVTGSNGTSNVKPVPLEKVLCYVLDTIAQGDFYGTIELKVHGQEVLNPNIKQQSIRVNNLY